ncbi:hypothetical protein B0A54_08202 [Friedmanniomyces endolithicus]|uniref:AB hydrolase-1 domain-containing protein n=1 Tax=Friedmanniomyces endolithicus TaxID=329885 RepID=A0A4U0V257_9PEZI|nr:hypothetical protein B0A54_08202 [Friedmanniomyces endolithicus]
MWQALLYPALFAWFIDKCLLYLFNWRTENITPHQKLAAYPHLYSFTSTKSIVHWFQIIRHGTFQMYDDDEVTTATNPFALLGGNGSQYYKVAKFPTRNIKTPIVLVYGGSDSLVDIERMLKELPRHTVARKIPKYEHLDLLWAADVDELVFPHVLEALEQYGSTPEKTRVASLGWRRSGRRTLDGAAWGSQGSTAASLRSGYEEDEAVGAHARPAHTMAGRAVNGASGSSHGGNVAGFDFGLGDRPSTAEEGLDESDDDDEDDDHNGGPQQHALAFAPARHPRPEGWWSSGGDEESGEEEKENRGSGGGGLPLTAGAKAGVSGGGSGSGSGARKRRRDSPEKPSCRREITEPWPVGPIEEGRGGHTGYTLDGLEDRDGLMPISAGWFEGGPAAPFLGSRELCYQPA